MGDACWEAARTRDDLADIINIALEDLVRQRYELPAFNTVLRAARAARLLPVAQHRLRRSPLRTTRRLN
jgi:hypothetical protein